MSDVATLNVALLKYLAKTRRLSVSGLVQTTVAVIDEIVAACNARWVPNTYDMGVARFTMPHLMFNTASLLPYMNR
jgi:hypothetical protein